MGGTRRGGEEGDNWGSKSHFVPKDGSEHAGVAFNGALHCKRGRGGHLVPEDGGEHAGVVPLALLLGVHHALHQVLAGDLVDYGVERLLQDLVACLERPRRAVAAVLAVQQLHTSREWWRLVWCAW